MDGTFIKFNTDISPGHFDQFWRTTTKFLLSKLFQNTLFGLNTKEMKTGHRNLFSISQYEMENKNAMEISVLLLLFQENKQFSALSCVIPNVKANKYNAYQASDSPLPSINNGYDECVQKHC